MFLSSPSLHLTSPIYFCFSAVLLSFEWHKRQAWMGESMLAPLCVRKGEETWSQMLLCLSRPPWLAAQSWRLLPCVVLTRMAGLYREERPNESWAKSNEKKWCSLMKLVLERICGRNEPTINKIAYGLNDIERIQRDWLNLIISKQLTNSSILWGI